MAGITGVPHVIPHRIHINGGDAAEIQARIRGAAAQTAVILAVQNNAGTNLFTVDNDGDVSILGNLDAVVNETITGNITLTGILTVNGNTTLGDAGTDTLTVNAASTFSGTVNLTNTLVSTSNGTFSGFVSSTVLNLPRRGAAPATMGSTGRIYTFVGDVGTTELWYRDAAGNDVQITDAGALEGASLFWDDDEYIRMGNTAAAPDVRIGWNTTQTVDAWYFGTADAQNVLLVAENGDRAFDFAHGAQANPTVFIHSATQSTTQWISLTHNATDGVLTTGAGAISLVPSGVGASSLLLTNSAGARTVAHTVVTFNGTAGAAAGGTLFDINVSQTGAGANPLFDIDISAVYTGEIFSAVIGAVAYTSDVINIDLGNTQTAAQIAVLDAGDSARTTDAIQIIDNTTSTGDVFGISVAGAAGSGAVFDIDIGAVAWAGDILNLDLGATSTTGQLMVLTSGAAARTTHLIELNDAGTSTGIGLDINKTGTSYSNNLGYVDIVRSGNFTGVDTETGIDFRIAPSFTLTEPAAGTFNLYGALIDMSGITVTAGAGTTLVSALTLTANTDADIGRSRALVLGGSNVQNSIQFGTATTAPIMYSTGAENIRFIDSTNVNGIALTLAATAVQLVRTASTTSGSLSFQSQTFTPGATHSAVQITPAWASENFAHTALTVSATQNGANTQALRGASITMTKATGATVLDIMSGLYFNSPAITGTVTNSEAIRIEDQTNAGATTSRGITFVTTGVANSIWWGASALQYSNGANNVRIADATNINGIEFVLGAGADQNIRTISTTNGDLILQNITFTAGATHASVRIVPSWTAENQSHIGLDISITQNGANSSNLIGLSIDRTKATAVSILDTVVGLQINDVTLTAGSVTNNYAINIASQSGATTNRAMRIIGTGAANAIEWGDSALQYSNAAENIFFVDSTNTRGISMTFTAAGDQTINTTATTNSGLVFQSTTFTPGAAYSAVTIGPTFAAEDFSHTALTISTTQNGASTSELRGLNIALTKATGATTLTNARSLRIAPPTITGFITNNFGLVIGDQSPAGVVTEAWGIYIESQTATATTTRAINIVGTGLNNALRLGNTIDIYASAGADLILNVPTAELTQFTTNALQTMLITGVADGVTVALAAVNAAYTASTTLSWNTAARTATIALANASGDFAITPATVEQRWSVGTHFTGTTSGLTITQSAIAGGGVLSPTSLTITGGAHTALANADLNEINLNLLRTVQFTGAGGGTTISTVREIWLQPASYSTAGAGALTITDATGLSVPLPRTAAGGGGTTITNSRGLYIAQAPSGTITNGYGIDITDISIAGSTTSFALRVASQTANATTTRAIEIVGTGVNNAIRLGASPNIYSSAAEVIRFGDSTNARTMSFTLTAGGAQTIGTSAGALTLAPTSANVTTAADVDFSMAAGGRFFGGGVQINSQTLGANTNLTMDENDGHIDITSGAVSNNTITLPAASGNQGMIVSFYLEVDGGFDAVITRAGADVIQNGAADLANTTVTLDTAGEYLMLQCVSSSMWQIVVNQGGVVA